MSVPDNARNKRARQAGGCAIAGSVNVTGLPQVARYTRFASYPPRDQGRSGRPVRVERSAFKVGKSLRALRRAVLFTRQHKARRLVGATGALIERIGHLYLHEVFSDEADGSIGG